MRMNRRQTEGKHMMYDLNCLPHSTIILSLNLHKQPSIHSSIEEVYSFIDLPFIDLPLNNIKNMDNI